MPIITDSPFVPGVTPLVLDPAEVAEDRVELELNTGPIRVAEEGPDWGDGAIEQYLAEAERGQLPVGFRVPNRTITIPLILGANGPDGFATARSYLQAKVALFQREGGHLKRGDTGHYADITGAALRLPDRYGHLGAEVDVVLTLEAIPDFYGDEIELTLHPESTNPELVAVETDIEGDYPGRVRVEVNDLSGAAQLGLLAGFRCRHYSDADTARLAYAATDLEPLDAAGVVGSTVEHADLGTNWTPVLGTNIGGTDWMTHVGSYGVWVKVESDDGDQVQLRWVYDVGDLVLPEENLRVTIPGPGNTYLLYLGQMRLDRPPVGTHRWQGQLQARGAAGGEHVAAYRLYFQPLDEGAVKLRAPATLSEGLVDYIGRDEFNQTVSGGSDPLTGLTASAGGVWAGDGDGDDFDVEDAGHTAQRTAVSDTADLGRFALSGAAATELVAVQVDVKSGKWGTSAPTQRMGVVARYTNTTNWLRGEVTPTGTLRIRKSVAGTQTSPAGGTVVAPAAGGYLTLRLVVAADGRYWLWAFPQGATPGDPKIVGQDADLATGGALDSGSVGIIDELVAAGADTRNYDNFAAWVPNLDAVVHPNQSCELRTEGFFREDASGAGWGPVSDPSGSDQPRIPPSGLEGRPVEFFLLTSTGDLVSLPDGAASDKSMRIRYRASWLFPQA